MKRITKIADTPARNHDELLEEFLIFKAAQGLAERTLLDYKKHIRLFFTRHPDAFDDLKGAVYGFMSEQVAPATYNLRRAYLKNFFAWCVNEGVVTDNPFAGLKKKPDEGRTRAVDGDVLKKLLSLPDKTTFAGYRDHTLFLLLLDCGIRPGEALSLKVDDFDGEAKAVTVGRAIAKTRRTRILPLSNPTIKAIKKLVKARPDNWDKGVPIFASYEGKPLSMRSLQSRLEKYSKQLGVKITLYDLRHSAAIMMLRGGMNAHVLAKI